MSAAHRSEGPEAFVFDVNAPMVRFTDQEILDGLRQYAAAHGHQPFRMKDFMAWKDRRFDAQTVSNRFGWRRAQALVGITGGRVAKYETEELIANLETVWRQMGRRP